MSISWCDLSKDLNEKLSKMFKKENLFMEFNPGKHITTREFKDVAPEIINFEVQKSDVWFISFPRTGSTWCQEMVWLIGNNLDYERAKAVPQYVRCPILEMVSYFPGDDKKAFKENLEKSIEWAKNQPRPRFLKTHLWMEFLPAQIHSVKPKIIYSVRNTKDVAVSFFHHMRTLHQMDTSFQEFMETYLEGKFPLGTYWEHLAQYSKIVGQSNVLILKYEDMKNDPVATIRKTAKFLEKDLSEEQILELCDFLSFDKMKTNTAVNFQPVLEQISREKEDRSLQFIRNGKIGDWKNYLSEDVSKRFDELNRNYSHYELVQLANSDM